MTVKRSRFIGYIVSYWMGIIQKLTGNMSASFITCHLNITFLIGIITFLIV